MKIAKLFPVILFVFDKLGLSLSESQRIKEEIRNENQRKLKTLEGELYKTKREVISASGTVTEVTELSTKVKPEDFIVLDEISEKNSRAAWLGQAINLVQVIRLKLVGTTDSVLASTFGIVEPSFNVPMPVKKMATMSSDIEKYCDLDNAEELFRQASMELLNKIGGFMKDAIALEGAAAVYGKQVHNDSFIRKMMNAPKTKETTTKETSTIIVYSTPVLGYEKEEFTELEKQLVAQYTELQQKRNSIFKQIKDIARTLQLEYDEEYKAEVENWRKLQSEYLSAMTAYSAEINKLRTELLQEIASFKVKE